MQLSDPVLDDLFLRGDKLGYIEMVDDSRANKRINMKLFSIWWRGNNIETWPHVHILDASPVWNIAEDTLGLKFLMKKNRWDSSKMKKKADNSARLV